MSRQILEFPHTKFHENPHGERRPVLRRQVDEQMDKAILAVVFPTRLQRPLMYGVNSISEQ
jgi:hypothetical protein